MTGVGRTTGLSLRLRRPGDEEGGLVVRGLPGTGVHSRVCSQKARQKGTPIFNHPTQDYLALLTPASHTCIGFHPQEQTMCLLQRVLPSEKPSPATLTSRSYRGRVPLANPVPTLVPLGSLSHPASNLALQLTPVPDPFTSALPSSRDRHCQQRAQAWVSLAQNSNKGEATGLRPGSVWGS